MVPNANVQETNPLWWDETPKNFDKPTTSDEKEIHLNARAENYLFESLSMDIFNQVLARTKANEIWLKLHELHDRTSNVHKLKYCLAK